MAAADEHPVVTFARMYSTQYSSGRDVHEMVDRLAEMPPSALDKAAHAAMIMVSDVYNGELRAAGLERSTSAR
jgi:hypothetical protein